MHVDRFAAVPLAGKRALLRRELHGLIIIPNVLLFTLIAMNRYVLLEHKMLAEHISKHI